MRIRKSPTGCRRARLKQPHDFGVAIHSRYPQRIAASGVNRVHLRSTRQQQPDYFRIPLVSGDEQGPHTLIAAADTTSQNQQVTNLQNGCCTNKETNRR